MGVIKNKSKPKKEKGIKKPEETTKRKPREIGIDRFLLYSLPPCLIAASLSKKPEEAQTGASRGGDQRAPAGARLCPVLPRISEIFSPPFLGRRSSEF
jgi:hypothetical protein